MPHDRTDLSKESILIYDRGAFSYVAQFLAKYFGSVKYCTADASLYPSSPKAHIGKGLPGVEWVESLYPHYKKVSCVFFPYLYDEPIMLDLKERGIPVCGSGRSSRAETDKRWFYAQLKKLGLPLAKTYRADGVEDARKYCEKAKGKIVLKYAEKYRGDFESFVHKNIHATNLILDDVVHGLGSKRAEEITILCQSWIDGIETGVDPFRLNGKMPRNSCLGYEVKDDGYIMRVFPDFPLIIQKVLDKLAPIYDKLGYAGPYSNEMRITDKGLVYPIDETNRCGSPPTASVIEVYGESWARALLSLANGRMPELIPEHRYGAEIKLRSIWHIKHQVHVGCPKDYDKHLKLANCTRRSGQYYCVPDSAETEEDEFGSIVGVGMSLKEATNNAMDAIKELEVYKMDYDKDIFNECQEVIEKGRKFGILL